MGGLWAYGAMGLEALYEAYGARGSMGLSDDLIFWQQFCCLKIR